MTIHIEVISPKQGDGFVYRHADCGNYPMTLVQEFEGRSDLGISPSRVLFCACGLRISYLVFGEAAHTVARVRLDEHPQALPKGSYDCNRAGDVVIVPGVPVEWA